MRLFLFVIFAVLSIDAKTLDSTQVFNKSTVKVTQQTIGLSKEFYADIVLDETDIKDITLRFDGFVQKLYHDKNYSYVKQGEKLFSIYSNEVYTSLQEFLAIDLTNQRRYKSYMDKFKNLDIDTRQIKILLKSKEMKENIDIYSPYSGHIISKKINSGSGVKKGQLLFQIASMEQLWAIVKVYQKDLSYIKKDMKVKLFIEGVGVINSTVDFIYPSIDSTTKTVNVRVVVDNKNLKIFPGMFAKAKIYEQSKTMLVLPKSAVLTKADQHFVFVPSGDQFEPKEIVARRINTNQFEVISGLNLNEEVIDKAMFLLDSDAITNGLYNSKEDEVW
jgi:Cu(I)/Ag(I) efflux system membrane fusion protein